ncbi:MAG: DNA repair protein RecO [Sphingomonadaceae bacterium]
MLLRVSAVIVAVRAHGEHGAIVRALTAEHGLQVGYVRGGRSRHLRPVLLVGNTVEAAFQARSNAQLASLTVELAESRAGLLAEPLAALAIEWVTALVAVTLPEGHPYPRVHAALDGVLRAIALAPSARGWADALVNYEVLVLDALGFGIVETANLDVQERLRLNLARLEGELLTGRRAAILPARGRLTERLARALAG